MSFVEKRTYTLHVGKQAEYLKLYEEEGLKVQTRILPRLVGYFTAEMGELNQIIHMWGYDSLDQRTQKRKELFADPAWIAYVGKVRPLIIRQESQLLIPTAWSPAK